ncbi:MAG: aspartate kinase [Anaerolineaceae bacterium]|nr:aspartate kinase [Anaerolineaceae bacterium]
MATVIQKFGGTSVATAAKIKRAAGRAIAARVRGDNVVVVVSARGKTTDELVAMTREITDRPQAREMDQLLATGEQISIALMAMAIHAAGQGAISFTGGQVGLVTDSVHTKARIQEVNVERMDREFAAGNIVIVAGFQGIDANHNVTTLGRGGSDTTALALAAALKLAGEPDVICEIYTDVDGVYTADPRKVPRARKLDTISYEEMLELASLGAGVMHSRAIEFGKKYDIPIHVRSSLNDSEGTMITKEAPGMEGIVVRGAALTRDLAKVTIRAVPDTPGVAARIFHQIAASNVVVDDIIQNISSDGQTDMSFTVALSDADQVAEVADHLVKEIGAQAVEFDKQVSKVSIVGVGMRSHTGVAEKMFKALAEAEVNIQMITTSEIKISCIIGRQAAEEALRAVHDAFDINDQAAD